ncbi:hypothetical protein [Actinokineospora sp.]|uniref:hypothetical protein n=1 Tax=Actinokineospora sp. TaxID=1872133 RepID=UPI003D6B1F0E
MDGSGREAVLRSAGLEVLGTSESAGELRPEQAWERIISLDAAPWSRSMTRTTTTATAPTPNGAG